MVAVFSSVKHTSLEHQSMVKISDTLWWFSLACLFSVNPLLAAFHRRTPRTESTRYCSMIEGANNPHQQRRLPLLDESGHGRHSYPDLVELNRKHHSPASSDHDDSDEYACCVLYYLHSRFADATSPSTLRYSTWFFALRRKTRLKSGTADRQSIRQTSQQNTAQPRSLFQKAEQEV